MARPCLPRCFTPTFNDCDVLEELVCCLDWEIQCGGEMRRCTYDTGVIAAVLNSTYSPRKSLLVDHLACFCPSNKTGEMCKYCWGEGVPLRHLMYDCNPPTITSGNDENFPELLRQVRARFTYDNDRWCVPEYLIPISETIDPDVYDIMFVNNEEAFVEYSPFLRWSCSGVATGAQITFEAGWYMITSDLTYTYIGSMVSGVTTEIITASKTVSPDWWYGDPPPTITLDGLPIVNPWNDGTLPGEGEDPIQHFPDVIVYPGNCQQIPCGEPLDCFASCISGTKDCDGTTPAHKPVIFFTLDIIDCCLSKTYALFYQESGESGSGYYGSGSCVVSPSVTLQIKIQLTCARSIDGSPLDVPPGYALLWVEFGTTTIFGTAWSNEVTELISMTCVDGGFTASGEVNDTDCGDGDGEWALFG